MITQNNNHRRLYLIFPLFLVAYEFATYLSNDMYIPAMPNIASDFGVSHNLAQLTFSLWLLGSTLLQPVMGSLSDRYGRRPIYFSGGVIFLIGLLLSGLTTHFGLLLLGRFLQGTAVCTMMATGYSTIHELFDEKSAIQVLAWMTAITLAAPAIGPLIGSLIMLVSTWRWIFLLLAIVSFPILVGLWRLMPETNPNPDKMALHLNRLLPTYRHIIFNPRFMVSTTCYSLINAGFAVWIGAGPFLVIQHLGFTAQQFGLLQIPVFVTFILGSLSIKYLINRVAANRLIQIGFSIYLVASIVMLILNAIWPASAWGLYIPLLFITFSFGFNMAPLNRLSIETSDQAMGATNAMLFFFMMGAGTLGSFMVSIVYNGQLVSISGLLVAIAMLSFVMNMVRVHITTRRL